MYIKYRDDLGYVVEKVDEDGVSFLEGFAYFNDRKVNCDNIELIIME